MKNNNRLQSMFPVADPFGLTSETASQRRARINAENDAEFLAALVGRRKIAGLSQSDVAERLGVAQSTVAAFERYDNDPKLSTIRRYAHAIGVIANHSLDIDTDGSAGESWEAITHLDFSVKRNSPLERHEWVS